MNDPPPPAGSCGISAAPQPQAPAGHRKGRPNGRCLPGCFRFRALRCELSTRAEKCGAHGRSRSSEVVRLVRPQRLTAPVSASPLPACSRSRVKVGGSAAGAPTGPATGTAEKGRRGSGGWGRCHSRRPGGRCRPSPGAGPGELRRAPTAVLRVQGAESISAEVPDHITARSSLVNATFAIAAASMP